MEGDYYHTKESVEEYIKLAKDVNGGDLIEKLKEYLPPHSSLLEIGSGPGTDWNLLKKDYHVTGSDNSQEFLDHLTSNNPNGDFLLLDATTLKVDQQFNGIYSNKVLHHLNDHELERSIERQSEILYPGGMICHSFWRGEGSETFKGMFVNYHNDVGLRKHFETYFEVCLMHLYQEFEQDDSILLIAKLN